MRASLILLFGKTKAFFGKDTARKKTAFLHTLFVENGRETRKLSSIVIGCTRSFWKNYLLHPNYNTTSRRLGSKWKIELDIDLDIDLGIETEI